MKRFSGIVYSKARQFLYRIEVVWRLSTLNFVTRLFLSRSLVKTAILYYQKRYLARVALGEGIVRRLYGTWLVARNYSVHDAEASLVTDFLSLAKG